MPTRKDSSRSLRYEILRFQKREDGAYAPHPMLCKPTDICLYAGDPESSFWTTNSHESGESFR